jgi:hypothetical protein
MSAFCIYIFIYRTHAVLPTNPLLLNNVWWDVQIIKLVIMHSSPVISYFLFLIII